ncbi:MAG: hypothetical protein ACYC2G_11910 [Gemmatimonadaceae bacterium]
MTTTAGRRTTLALAGASLALSATACGGVPTALDDGREPTFVGGAPVAARDAAIVGIWFRRTFATDGLGNVFGVETIWTFTDDGTVQRRLVTDDLTGGIANELVATGSWSSTAGTGDDAGVLTIRFTAPTPTVLQFQYQLASDSQGLLLVLDGILYRRLVP